jgi:hypothetical protein
MTELEKKTKAAVIAFIEREFSGAKVKKVRHIHPRCYVLSRAASACLLVACPPCDDEPQLKNIPKHGDGGISVNVFDDSLKAGDWCSVAYVVRSGSCQNVAVKAV